MSEKFKKFIEAYEAFTKSELASRAIRSEDVSARDDAREFALASAAANIPGFENIAADPIAAADVLNKDADVDKLLINETRHFRGQSEQRYAADKKDIIANASEKGLAAIVLNDIPSLNIKGDETSEAHAAYQDLRAKMPEKGERINHREMYNVLMKYMGKRIKAKISGDEHLKKVKGLDKATLETAMFVLASSAESCLSGVAGLIIEYKKEFEDHLPDEKIKVEYARGLLTGMKDTSAAMRAVYAAEQAEANLEAKKK